MLSRAVLVTAFLAGTAHAEALHILPTPKQLPASKRAVAVAAAIFPGVLVHGLGSYLVGEKRLAKRLFYSELVSGAALAAGGGFIKATGASGYSVEPGVPLAIFGVGGFLAS